MGRRKKLKLKKLIGPLFGLGLIGGGLYFAAREGLLCDIIPDLDLSDLGLPSCGGVFGPPAGDDGLGVTPPIGGGGEPPIGPTLPPVSNPGTPGGGLGQSDCGLLSLEVKRALDTDRSGYIGDAEQMAALESWIGGAVVPSLGRPLTDDEILGANSCWTLQDEPEGRF